MTVSSSNNTPPSQQNNNNNKNVNYYYNNNKEDENNNNNQAFTTKDIPPPPLEITLKKESSTTTTTTTANNNKEEPTTSSQKPTENNTKKKITIIPESRTKQEYQKAGIRYTPKDEYDQRERDHRLTKGRWSRKVTKVVWIRTADDNEFLDWNEIRKGKTDMQRNIETPVEHVSRYEIPTVPEKVVYDPETEDYKTVTVEDSRPQGVDYRYEIPFSKDALDELIEDSVPYKTEYIIMQEFGRPYHVTKAEMHRASSFERLYNRKAPGGMGNLPTNVGEDDNDDDDDEGQQPQQQRTTTAKTSKANKDRD